MKSLVCLLMLVAVGLSSPTAWGADWQTYESSEFNVQFDLPADWEVEADENTLVAAPESGGMSFVIVAYKDGSIGTEELFQQFVNEIGLEVEGEYEEVEDFNGFHAMLGSGAAEMDGEVVMVLAAALTLDDDNIVAYIFCHADLAEENQGMMEKMLASISPLAN